MLSRPLRGFAHAASRIAKTVIGIARTSEPKGKPQRLQRPRPGKTLRPYIYTPTYPAYLGLPADPADDTEGDAVIRANYDAWALRYGYDALGAYEAAFLLNVAPWAVTNGLAPLKIVEIGTTNIFMSESGDFGLIATMMGYSGEYLPCRRIVLASDVTELWQSEWGDARELCNGYLVLRITDDLSLPKSAWQAISWFAQFEDGRAVIMFPEIFVEPIRRHFETVGGKPVSGLFLSVCIETAPVENPALTNALIQIN